MINKHLVTVFLWDLFLHMKEKNLPFSFLNDASSEEVIVASNSYIWYCTYIL